MPVHILGFLNWQSPLRLAETPKLIPRQIFSLYSIVGVANGNNYYKYEFHKPLSMSVIYTGAHLSLHKTN